LCLVGTQRPLSKLPGDTKRENTLLWRGVFKNLYQANNLRSLELLFDRYQFEDFPYNAGLDPLRLQRAILESLAIDAPAFPPALLSLTINNLLTHYAKSYFSDTSLSRLSALFDQMDRLRITVLSKYLDAYREKRTTDNFWIFYPLRLTNLCRLRKLVLGWSPFAADKPPVVFNELEACVSLTTLSLSGFDFDSCRPTGKYYDQPEIGIEEFILRNRATLRNLQLKHCYMMYEYSGDGSSASEPQRTWKDIWDTFAEQLGELKRFQAIAVHCCESGPFYITNEVMDRDDAALKRLRRVVRHRSRVVKNRLV
jgi:hypothetical protein